MRLAATLAFLLVPLAASAGSWPIRCELESEKLTLAVEHYNPSKKGTEYDAKPMDVEIWHGDKVEKAKTKKREGGTWLYTFKEFTVFYTGIETPDAPKHAVFVKKDGTWLGEVTCKQ